METKSGNRPLQTGVMGHHVFCNYFFLPAEGCKMCEQFREKYPEGDEGLTPEQMVEKYFPNVTVK